MKVTLRQITWNYRHKQYYIQRTSMWRNLIISQQNKRYLGMSRIKRKMGQQHKMYV